MKVSKLRLGLNGVDLAHVPALVLLLHVVDVQKPRPVLVVRHRDARIPGDDMVVHSQDCRLLKVHPRNLQHAIVINKRSRLRARDRDSVSAAAVCIRTTEERQEGSAREMAHRQNMPAVSVQRKSDSISTNAHQVKYKMSEGRSGGETRVRQNDVARHSTHLFVVFGLQTFAFLKHIS